MRSRNREINIFNLSMLDVIAGAMGAFLIVMVILMPYYKKTHIDYQAIMMAQRERLEAAEARSQAAEKKAKEAENRAQSSQEALSIAEVRARAAEDHANEIKLEAKKTERELEAQRSKNSALQSVINKTFILVHIHWPTQGPDIDLHVVDPNGNRFNWQQRTASGATGRLSVDSQIGPGNEVFTDSQATPGDYRIYLHFYRMHSSVDDTAVYGSLVYRDGTIDLPGVELKYGQTLQLMAIARVDAEGRVSLAPNLSAP